MLLACIPGATGDGGQCTEVNLPSGSPNTAVTDNKSGVTYAGKPMNDAILRRVLTVPTGAEVTGVAESPDGKVLFVNIQNPVENTTAAGFVADIFESNWPANGSGIAAAYGPYGASATFGDCDGHQKRRLRDWFISNVGSGLPWAIKVYAAG